MTFLKTLLSLTLTAASVSACIENAPRTGGVISPDPSSSGAETEKEKQERLEKEKLEKERRSTGGGGGTIGGGTGTATGGTQPPPTTGTKSVIPESMVGTWEGPCLRMFAGMSQQTRIYKANGEFEIADRVFVNDKCTQDLDVTSIRKGTLTAAQSLTVAGATLTNATLLELHMSSNYGDTVLGYNTDRYCGFSDWQNGVAKEILSLGCATVNFVTLKKNDMEYDLVVPSGAQLFVGKRTEDKKGFQSEAQRPFEVDRNAPYVKK